MVFKRQSLLASAIALIISACALADVAQEPTPAGTWTITGHDASQTTWTGLMALTIAADGSIAGHIDWSASGGRSDGASGREQVAAIYDPATRQLRLKGSALERARHLSLGSYAAEMSEDGNRLLNGKWSADGAPGGWEAKRDARDANAGFVDKKLIRADGSAASYVIFVPHDHTAAKPLAVILFLHGLGGTKTEGGDPLDDGLGPYIRKHERAFPFLAVFPQAEELWWTPRGVNAQTALAALDQTLKEYKTDPKRVYLTGLSMGGTGTWHIPISEPKRWAAIVPICGWGIPEQAEQIKDIPCWAFHGAADPLVPVAASREMIAALRNAGGNPKYTEYPNAKHSCWDKAYATPELWEWLVNQKRE